MVGGREEYYRDLAAPRAQEIVPAAFAAVWDRAGRVLLVQRADDHYWELPGGDIEIGESAAQAVVREVGEEASLDIEVTALAGVDSDPTHIVVYPAQPAQQQLAVCFHARPSATATLDGIHPDRVETIDVAWTDPTTLDPVAMHPAMRRRLLRAVAEPQTAHFD